MLDFDQFAEDLSGRLEKLVGASEKAMDEKLDKINNDLTSNLIITISTAIVAVFLGLGAAWTITRGISKPLGKMVDMLKDIAQGEGDLTKRLQVDTTDEMGELAMRTIKSSV